MTTERSIDDLLRKVQAAPNESLVAYSYCWEGVFPSEGPDEKWLGLQESEASTMRAAIRMGLLTASSQSWVAEFPEEHVPDGGDYVLTLSGLGTERLIKLNESVLFKAKRQIVENVPTIIVAVLIAVASSWLLKITGLEK
ncbi:hypothetical protein LZG00_00715 [Rhodobacteraceae bacterium LMO-12]|nr:hypothetical protein [Rhodobacteraceae bacterium LMO-JJ12]